MKFKRIKDKYIKNEKKTLMFIYNKCQRFLKEKSIYICNLCMLIDGALRIDFINESKKLLLILKMYEKESNIIVKIEIADKKFKYISKVSLSYPNNFIKILKEVCNYANKISENMK